MQDAFRNEIKLLAHFNEEELMVPVSPALTTGSLLRMEVKSKTCS